MKYLKMFENFSEGRYERHWYEFKKWLSDKDFELYDGEEDLYNKFIEVSTDDSLTIEDKSSSIASFIEEKWGLYGGYESVIDYLSDLFMDEV